MKDKREIEQKKIYDQNGKLKYVIIPNYTKNPEFMTKKEIKYYKFLINVVTTIRERTNKRLEVFPQVATNRIIKQK